MMLEPDQRLRRDKPTAVSALLALFGTVLVLVAVINLVMPDKTQFEARENPLYWLILALPIPWVWGLSDYKPWALKMIRPVLFAAPFALAFVTLVASTMDRDVSFHPWPLGLTCVLSLVGGLFYNRSLLRAEGPGG